MHFDSFDSLLSSGRDLMAEGPIALIFAEDEVEIDTTIRHHVDAGFRRIVVLADRVFAIGVPDSEKVIRVDYDTLSEGALCRAINMMIDVCDGQWLYYCYNAEYLFYPFCEHRTVGEMITFNTEERRDTILTYVIDLYAGDLWKCPNAVSLDDAHLDNSGYYALARHKPGTRNPEERQLDFFGGLRWRFEEYIPSPRRRIDRVSLFRARKGVHFRPDHTFTHPEYNTYSCPWHNNLTAAVCSFRTAKALKRNPGSTFGIETFRWHNSSPFDWHSQQLLDLGLMEPGQWF